MKRREQLTQGPVADVRVPSPETRFCEYPHFDDPLLQWHAALSARDLAVTRLVWSDTGRGPKLVQFKYRGRPCSLNGLFELGVPRGDGNTAVGVPALSTPVGPSTVAVGQSAILGLPPSRLPVAASTSYSAGLAAGHNAALAAVQAVTQDDRLGTVRATIDGVKVPAVRWHTHDARGTEGAVMVGDQEWQVAQFKGGATRATAHLGVEPDRVLERLCAATEAFENGTVNVEVSARARGTSRTFRRKFR